MSTERVNLLLYTSDVFDVTYVNFRPRVRVNKRRDKFIRSELVSARHFGAVTRICNVVLLSCVVFRNLNQLLKHIVYILMLSHYHHAFFCINPLFRDICRTCHTWVSFLTTISQHELRSPSTIKENTPYNQQNWGQVEHEVSFCFSGDGMRTYVLIPELPTGDANVLQCLLIKHIRHKTYPVTGR